MKQFYEINKDMQKSVMTIDSPITISSWFNRYSLGRLKSFTNYDNKTVSYDYDSVGNLITLIYPDNKLVNYEYDTDNRLKKVRIPENSGDTILNSYL